MNGMMDKFKAAKEWGVTPDYARILMRTMPEAKKEISVSGFITWMVPVGTPKPTKTPEWRKGQRR